MQSNLIRIEKMRRSIYHLGRDVKASSDDVVNLIQDAVKFAPTPFNTQAIRVVILLGGAHEQAWQIIARTVQKLVDAKVYPKLLPKLRSFKAGWGTILFYTDTDINKRSIQKFSGVSKTHFLEWSEQAQGMSQVSVWDALAEHKIGASIHHYSSLFGHQVADNLSHHFKIPASWQLRTEMVFGSIEKPAHPKSFIKNDQRFKVIR